MNKFDRIESDKRQLLFRLPKIKIKGKWYVPYEETKQAID